MNDRIGFASINATRSTVRRPAAIEHKPLTAEQRAEMKAAFAAEMEKAEKKFGKPRTIADAAGTSNERISFKSI